MTIRKTGRNGPEEALAPGPARARSGVGDYARGADEDFGRAADEGYPLGRREEGEDGNVDRAHGPEGLRR